MTTAKDMTTESLDKDPVRLVKVINIQSMFRMKTARMRAREEVAGVGEVIIFW